MEATAHKSAVRPWSVRLSCTIALAVAGTGLLFTCPREARGAAGMWFINPDTPVTYQALMPVSTSQYGAVVLASHPGPEVTSWAEFYDQPLELDEWALAPEEEVTAYFLFEGDLPIRPIMLDSLFHVDGTVVSPYPPGTVPAPPLTAFAGSSAGTLNVSAHGNTVASTRAAQYGPPAPANVLKHWDTVTPPTTDYQKAHGLAASVICYHTVAGAPVPGEETVAQPAGISTAEAEAWSLWYVTTP